jgi:hypothetical protein
MNENGKINGKKETKLTVECKMKKKRIFSPVEYHHNHQMCLKMNQKDKYARKSESFTKAN